MQGLDLLGWIIIGFLAGSISGWFVRGTRSVQGCLPTIVVGILGGVIGGWLARELSNGPVEGFIGALVFATIGSMWSASSSAPSRVAAAASDTGPAARGGPCRPASKPRADSGNPA